jgi:hypothetical protein
MFVWDKPGGEAVVAGLAADRIFQQEFEEKIAGAWGGFGNAVGFADRADGIFLASKKHNALPSRFITHPTMEKLPQI